MALPDTLSDLQSAGYVYQGTGPCRACQVQMAWFLTPRGKKMPFSRKPGSDSPKRFESHHSVCPQRARFKK
jgi:hypothetical protein